MRTFKIAAPALAAGLLLAGCSGQPEPAPTVIVTATPEAAPTVEPPVAEAGPTAVEPGQVTEHPAAVAEPAAPVAPTQEPEGSYFGGEDSMVASVEVMDDDIIITLKTSSEANATQTHAPYVLQEAIDNMTGSENAAQIDLVVVYSSDGVMVASDRIPGGKWQ